MLGLQRMVEELPRYNLPEINENGDIIIRRIDPHGKSGTAEATRHHPRRASICKA